MHIYTYHVVGIYIAIIKYILIVIIYLLCMIRADRACEVILL